MAKILKDNFAPGILAIQLTADWLNTVARRLNNITCYNGEVEIDEYGVDIFPEVHKSSLSSFSRPFDFTEISTDNFKISDAQTLNATWYRGKRIESITAGAGLSFDTDGWIATSALTESVYVWLEMDNSDAGATSIIMGTDMQADPDDARYDYIEVIPLWYIPFADSTITASGIYDLRANFRLSAMA
jgi:hypothetical protein